MRDRSTWLKRTALGAAGGFAGTLAIQALLQAGQKWFPQAAPPIRQEPGKFMLERAEETLPERIREHIPAAAESTAAQALGMGYGLTFGALYGALRPEGGSPLRDGIALGMLCWAVGYLGWLPGLGLMPPVWKQSPVQVLVPAADLAVYGMTAVAAYDWLSAHA